MMTIKIIRSDKVYRTLLEIPATERRGIFKEQILAPFKPKFYRHGIPKFSCFFLYDNPHKLPMQGSD